MSLFYYEKIKNWPFVPLVERYTVEDVRVYAEGIGVGMPGPYLDSEAILLSQENDLQALPMMAIILNQGAMWTQDPNTGIDWTKTVHAEESVTLHGVLPNNATLVANYGVDEIFDKGSGKGALMYEHRQLDLEDGTPIATVKIGTFLRGNGGFGGTSGAAPSAPKVPDHREAGAGIEIATPSRDNVTYQLGQEFLAGIKSELLGSSEPMLRGVCSFGLAGRAILKLACDNQPARLHHLGLRYIAPVFAEETLRTEVWFLDEGKAAFRVSSVERETVVMDNGVAEFNME